MSKRIRLRNKKQRARRARKMLTDERYACKVKFANLSLAEQKEALS
jgi:hypothetical protein